MTLFWVSFIIGEEKPYLLSHSTPYITLDEANAAIKKTLKQFNVILSYIQKQNTKTGKISPVVITPYIDALGAKRKES